MPARASWKPRSVQLLESSLQRVFSRRDLGELLVKNAAELGTPRTLTVQRFIDTLKQLGQLRLVSIPSVGEEPKVDRKTGSTASDASSGGVGKYEPFSRYVWGSASVYEVALSLRTGSYLSHASAVFLHGLTTQIPRTIYVNKEQSEKPTPKAQLTQQGIDRAFNNKPRRSNYVFQFEQTRIVLLSGKNTRNLEVSEISDSAGHPLAATKLERTLIDIAVRPNYSGGVFEVLEAYRGARDRVSVPTLVATLKKLSFVYPYHQAIGFYMQRAGHSVAQLSRLKSIGIEFDFYLGNQMPVKDLDPDWRVYYPSAL